MVFGVGYADNVYLFYFPFNLIQAAAVKILNDVYPKKTDLH